MQIVKPLIFISNDDGYQAGGVKALVEALRPLGDILVVAPSEARSGASCSITSTVPLRLKLVRREPGVEVYSCSGMPVDCVKLGLQELCERRPSVVVSGINHGNNEGMNVHYSGTMNIAVEAAMKHIPAVGFSLMNFSPDADFAPCQDLCASIVAKVLSEGLPEGVCLNVNFPASPIYKGVKVCRQAKGEWTNEWKKCDHPRGGSYYWLTGDYSDCEPFSLEADYHALRDGYVTVTPVTIDMTAYGAIDKIKSWNL